MAPSCENISIVEAIGELYKEKRWKEIIDRYHSDPERNKLLWVFPSEENLKFVDDKLKCDKLDRIVSVGCGSGLLEWIIQESCGISVTCIEVDNAWWKCKYAPPTFCELHYANEVLSGDEATQKLLANDKAAIMFCYFNNRPAFLEYLKYFKGSLLIIIGPGEGRETHTDPTPFKAGLSEAWSLSQFQEVRTSKDFIAIYEKNGNS